MEVRDFSDQQAGHPPVGVSDEEWRARIKRMGASIRPYGQPLRAKRLILTTLPKMPYKDAKLAADRIREALIQRKEMDGQD